MQIPVANPADVLKQVGEIVKVLKAMVIAAEKTINKGQEKDACKDDAPLSVFSDGYFNWRKKHSSVVKFLDGNGMTADTVDTAVGTFTLVNALLLTIPFGLVGSLGNNYWDWLEATMASCPLGGNLDGNTFHDIYQAIYSQLCGTVYTSISCLLLACFYYLLRPKEDADFTRWWNRGIYVVAMILVGTLIAVIIALTLAGFLITGLWYVTPTSYKCIDNAYGNMYPNALLTGMFFVIVPSIVGIFLMI